MKNKRLLKALARQPVDCTPVWLMRQAGRYLPEYRATRRKAETFMQLCKSPELACEVTLQPLNRFHLDAAIIFSDILVIPDAMGLKLQVLEGKGPVLEKTISQESDINRLEMIDESRLNYVYQAIRLVASELKGELPLIGFAGSPWTLACYCIHGQSAEGFPKAREMLSEQPHLLHNLLKKLTKSVELHCLNQIAAGANVIMLFDTWGGLLNTQDYQAFSLFYLKQIISNVKQHYNKGDIPVILFTRNGNQWLQQMIATGCDGIGIDWTLCIGEARRQVGGKVALQGNLNPEKLRGDRKSVSEAVKKIIQTYGPYPGHVFNLGHGITPDIEPDNVAIMVDTVHEFSQKFYSQGQA